jgi:hypothetical protein
MTSTSPREVAVKKAIMTCTVQLTSGGQSRGVRARRWHSAGSEEGTVRSCAACHRGVHRAVVEALAALQVSDGRWPVSAADIAVVVDQAMTDPEGSGDLGSAAIAARLDLEVEWVLVGRRTVTPARFCAEHAPARNLWVVDCAAGCGRGPIVHFDTGLSPDRIAEAQASVTGALRADGWRFCDGVAWCPECAARR